MFKLIHSLSSFINVKNSIHLKAVHSRIRDIYTSPFSCPLIIIELGVVWFYS